MATRKTKAAASPKSVEDAPPNPVIAAMESMASLVEATLRDAAAGGVPIGLTVFGLTVQINGYGDIGVEGSAQREGNHLFFASQAGLLLGAARAAAEIERD